MNALSSDYLARLKLDYCYLLWLLWSSLMISGHTLIASYFRIQHHFRNHFQSVTKRFFFCGNLNYLFWATNYEKGEFLVFKCGTWRLKQDNRSLESEPHDELSDTAFVTRGGLPGPEKRFEHTCDWICSQIRRNRLIFPTHCKQAIFIIICLKFWVRKVCQRTFVFTG